jgi:hypothetical protein
MKGKNKHEKSDKPRKGQKSNILNIKFYFIAYTPNWGE